MVSEGGWLGAWDISPPPRLPSRPVATRRKSPFPRRLCFQEADLGVLLGLDATLSHPVLGGVSGADLGGLTEQGP